MFTLIALGLGASYLYSLAATLVPGLFPLRLRQHGGSIPVYYEAAAVVTVLVLLGQVLELRAREKTEAPFRRSSSWRPRQRAAFGSTARTRKCPSTTSASEIDCGCDPVKQYPSTLRLGGVHVSR